MYADAHVRGGVATLGERVSHLLRDAPYAAEAASTGLHTRPLS